MSELTRVRRAFLRPFIVMLVVGALILFARRAHSQTPKKHKDKPAWVRRACGKVIEYGDGPVDTSSVKILKVLFVGKDTLTDVAWDTSDKTRPVLRGNSYWFYFDKYDEAIERELILFHKPCPPEQRA